MCFLNHKFIISDSLPRSFLAYTLQFPFNPNHFIALHHIGRSRLQILWSLRPSSQPKQHQQHSTGSISSMLLINVLSGEEPYGILPANSCEEFICHKYPGSVLIATIFPNIPHSCSRVIRASVFLAHSVTASQASPCYFFFFS